MTSLPHKRVDEAVWEREGYKTTLLIESGRTRQKMLVKNDDYTGDTSSHTVGGRLRVPLEVQINGLPAVRIVPMFAMARTIPPAAIVNAGCEPLCRPD